MKRKLLVSLCVLVMASVSFGDILIGNFEDDGLDYGNNFSGATTTDYATLESYSMKVDSGGGWVGLGEFYLGGTPAQTALASTGQIKLDLTAVPAQPDGWWGDIGLYVNAGGEVLGGGEWYDTAWVGGTPVGGTTEVTFQLPSDVMVKILQYNWWCNIGIQTMSRGTELGEADPITGEQPVLYDGTISYYIDNVRVVPEPATLSLLGVGALALIRRKR